MKKISLIIVLLIFIYSLVSADHKITRGPDVGEIYYIGPTATLPSAIYHSTDFGETATCMDSINSVESICADLTSSSLYKVQMPNNLYYSDDYGQNDSWIFRTSEGSYKLAGNRSEGEVFKGPALRSNDYGFSFTQNSLNGCFCSLKAFEIGNQNSIGYLLGDVYGTPDSVYILISYDNFENLELQYSFNWYGVYDYSLSRGTEIGELYLIKSAHYGDGSMVRELWFSSDYGENWIFKNHLLSNKIVGGRQPGELFILSNYRQLMGEIAHIFIYHSLDFGETFTVYHPFAYGEEPYYSDFSTDITEGTAPLTIQFTDLSSGDIQTWEWDFDLDGTVDSYEQNPEYTYQDTGFYSVKLRIYGSIYEDGYIKTDYIHVTDGSNSSNDELQIMEYELRNYPNPFNPSTTISFTINSELNEQPIIEIYNIKGQLVEELGVGNWEIGENLVTWNATEFSSGLYFYRINIKKSPIMKMILIK
jgi:PKD repeat protein